MGAVGGSVSNQSAYVPLSARSHHPLPSQEYEQHMTLARATQDPASDFEAVAVAAAAGDRDALAGLYERYADDIYRWVYVRVGTHHAAEDVTGEVWAKVARSIHTYQSTGHGFIKWLVTIAANTIRSVYRAPIREIPTESMLALDAPTGMAGPEDDALAEETRRVVAAALGKLSKRDAEVVTLRFFHRFSVLETATATGLSESNVKVIQHRAMRTLEKAIPASHARVSMVGVTEKGASNVRTTSSSHERASR